MVPDVEGKVVAQIVGAGMGAVGEIILPVVKERVLS